MSIALVALGAAVGAPLRYLLDRFVLQRFRTAPPTGTLVVNLVACLILGAVLGVRSNDVQLLAAIGFCGTFSTYSTFAFEVVRLAEESRGRAALAYLALTLAAGLGAIFVGSGLAALL